MLMAFDLLELDGEDQRKRTLRERRQGLEHLLDGERLSCRSVGWLLTGWKPGRKSCERATRGSWRKTLSRPLSGATLKWLKVKQRDYRVEERGWSSQSS